MAVGATAAGLLKGQGKKKKKKKPKSDKIRWMELTSVDI